MAQTEDARTEAAAPEPRGELSIRALAMPADTNQNGDIFGGWVLGGVRPSNLFRCGWIVTCSRISAVTAGAGNHGSIRRSAKL